MTEATAVKSISESAIPFEGAFGADVAGEPNWLAARRAAARDAWQEVGVPSNRNEEWRFTPVQSLLATSWQPAAGGTVAADRRDALLFPVEGPVVVLVDGRYDADLSKIGALPEGVAVKSLAQAIRDGDAEVEAHLGQYADGRGSPFAELSLAAFRDGLFVRVERGVSFPAPIQLVHLATGAADSVVNARVLLVVGEQGEATLIESFGGPEGAGYLSNVTTEVVMGAAARVEHIRLQREGEAAWHLGYTQVEQHRDSHYRSFCLSMGARLARHNLHTRLHGENVETLLYGLYLTRGEQLSDTHSAIHHDHPSCNSWEVYKGVLADRSRGVFNGKVLVDAIAQKTDAKQTNRNILLSDQAKVDTKPQLEIFADDVKCTHGATVGRLNEQQRYYLQTRGIGGKAAEELLIWAFAAEVLTEVTIPEVRAGIEPIVRERLEQMIG